jgi:O-antigen/teichoic acid export membrane protein
MRHLVPIVFNQVAGLVFGLVGIKLISKLVPPAVYGAYSLYLTLTQLGLLLTHSGLVNHAARYWQREEGQAGSYARYLCKMGWKNALPLIPVLVVVTAALSRFDRDAVWLWALPLLFVSNQTFALANVASGALNASARHWAFFCLGVISSGTRALFPALMVLLLDATFLVLGAGFALHGVAVLCWLVFVFRWAWNSGEASAEKQKKWDQELKEYGRPFILMGIGGWLLLSVDRWVVFHFFGEERAGIFALASNVAAILPNLISAGLIQFVFPSTFRRADAARTMDDWRKLARFCDYVTMIFLAIATVGLSLLAVVGPYLIGWLIAERYSPSMSLLLPAGMAAITVQANQFYYLLLQGQHNSAGMVRVIAAVAGLKTLGSALAALFSWKAFLAWLMISMILSPLLGRWMIRWMVFKGKLENSPVRL